MTDEPVYLDEATLELITRTHALRYRSRLGREHYKIFEEQVVDMVTRTYFDMGWADKGVRSLDLFMFTEYVDRWYEMQYAL